VGTASSPGIRTIGKLELAWSQNTEIDRILAKMTIRRTLDLSLRKVSPSAEMHQPSAIVQPTTSMLQITNICRQYPFMDNAFHPWLFLSFVKEMRRETSMKYRYWLQRVKA
jgi:hypothetical protein